MICTESFEDSFKHQHINLNDLLLTRSTTARETHRELLVFRPWVRFKWKLDNIAIVSMVEG